MAEINTSSINGNRAARINRSTAGKRREDMSDRGDFLPPPRPHINFIPGPDVLRTLVERALEALGRGIFWDRGSIINILL